MKLLGIDIGTSGVKVILLNPDGSVAANVTREYPVFSPHPLWSEQNPEDWWRATCQGVSQALAQSGASADEVAGVGFSGQMVGLVVLDQTGQPLRPCILWNDQRSGEVTDELTGRIGLNRILALTSNPLFASFVAPKIVWLRKNEPAVYARIRHVMMPKDYVRYRLTGQIGTEVSDASGTCLFSVRDRRWSHDMAEAMEIPTQWLPPCVESEDVVGQVTPQAAGQTGLCAGTPVVAGAGDQPAQALGSGIVRPGFCSVTIGTSGVVFAQSERHMEHPRGLLHAFCHSVRDQWYLMGVMLSAGGSFQWLRDVLGEAAPTSYDQMTAQAALAPAGCEGLVFLPYLTGERVPHSDPSARGGWIGLTRRHRLPHLVRAVMEGISFGLLDSLNLMRELGMTVEQVYASGGAARSPFWRQMLADVFGTGLVTTNVAEGAAFGAAMLAGIGTKVFSSAADASDAMIQVTSRCDPVTQTAAVYAENYAIYRPLYGQLKSSFHTMTEAAARQHSSSSEAGE